MTNSKKLEALRKEYTAKNEEHARMAGKLDGLREAVKAARDKMNDAAASGSVDDYLKLKAEADRAEAVLFVTETRLKAPALVSMESAVEAWADYEKNRGPQMSSVLAKLDQAMKDYVKALDAAVAEQDAALTIRQELVNMCGAKVTEFKLSNPIKMGNNDGEYRNAIDFAVNVKHLNDLAAGVFNPALEARSNYFRVIRQHIAKGQAVL